MNKNKRTIKNGWLSNVSIVPSVNKNLRPDPADIRLIVIHNISLPPNNFGGDYVDRFFCNELDPHEHPYFQQIYQLKVSAHLFIKRDGRISQYVPFHERAWHAGVSNYRGEENCNDFSIGIELEGADHIPYTEAQYQQLSDCCQALVQHYPLLDSEQITGHCDVSPGRKTDPGDSFDWALIKRLNN